MYPGLAAEDGSQTAPRRGARHSRPAAEDTISRDEVRASAASGGVGSVMTSSVADKLFADVIAPNRDALRNELIALYHQYMADANCALSMQTEYEQMIEQARDAHAAVSQRIQVLRTLLDAEFPGWEAR